MIAVATWLVAMALRRERALATAGGPRHPGAGRARRAHRADPPQPVAGRAALPAVDGDHRGDLPALVAAASTRATRRTRRRSRARRAGSPGHRRRHRRRCSSLGTVVTGSGPHAGDKDSSGKVHRTGLNVSSMSQLHADAVMVLVGLTVGLRRRCLYALGAAPAVRRAARRAARRRTRAGRDRLHAVLPARAAAAGRAAHARRLPGVGRRPARVSLDGLTGNSRISGTPSACQCRQAEAAAGARSRGVLGVLLVIWLIIGAIAAGQRHYYSSGKTNCAGVHHDRRHDHRRSAELHGREPEDEVPGAQQVAAQNTWLSV